MFERSSYRTFRRFSGVSRRFRRRFTPAGLAVVGGLAVTAMVGLDTEQSFAYQSFAILLCLLLCSAAFVPFFRGRFDLRRELPRFGSVGERFFYRVLVRNETRRVQSGLVLMDRIGNDLPTYDEFRQALQSSWSRESRFLAPLWTGRAWIGLAVLEAMAPGGTVEALVEVMPKRRGLLCLDLMSVGCKDPLGLVRGFFTRKLPQSVSILPRRYRVPPVALSGTVMHQPGGVALASSVGESQEYVFLRDYRRGDPLRHVHWKSWARTGRPIVKEFQNEYFVRHALVLDTFPGREDEAVFEEAVSVAASYACTLESRESLLDLMFVGKEAHCFTAGRGLARTEQLLEVLASVRPCVDGGFETLQDLVLEHAPVLSGCICVFQSWNEPRRELVRRLTGMGVPLQVLVVTPAGDAFKIGPEEGLPGPIQRLEVGRIEAGLFQVSGRGGGG